MTRIFPSLVLGLLMACGGQKPADAPAAPPAKPVAEKPAPATPPAPAPAAEKPATEGDAAAPAAEGDAAKPAAEGDAAKPAAEGEAAEAPKAAVPAAGGPGNITWETSAGLVTFPHDKHLSMGLKCESCHTAVFPMEKTTGTKMADIYAGKACGTCHKDAQTTCAKCHKM